MTKKAKMSIYEFFCSYFYKFNLHSGGFAFQKLSKHLIAILLFLSTQVMAETFRGKVDRNSNQTTVYDTNRHRRYSLTFINSITEKQMNRLTDGDYVSVTASIDSKDQNALQVSSIDYIGLSVLIGAWKSTDGLCYNFVGYTTFSVYVPPKGSDCSNAGPVVSSTKYTYFINPDPDQWNMLISSKEHQFFGQLKINNSKSIEIQLFDSETNAILGTVTLRR